MLGKRNEYGIIYEYAYIKITGLRFTLMKITMLGHGVHLTVYVKSTLPLSFKAKPAHAFGCILSIQLSEKGKATAVLEQQRQTRARRALFCSFTPNYTKSV